MSREITVEAPFEVPNSKHEAVSMRLWLDAMNGQLGRWGKDGREVGVGYVWYTRRGMGNEKLHLVTRRIKRCLKSAQVVDRLCEPYNLEQRIIYIRDGDGHGLLSLREG